MIGEVIIPYVIPFKVTVSTTSVIFIVTSLDELLLEVSVAITVTE